MGCCHFVSFLLSGKRFGVCNTHSSTFRFRSSATRQQSTLELPAAGGAVCGWLRAIECGLNARLALTSVSQPRTGRAIVGANGYNVVINWLTGYDTKSLSVCWVSAINNPGEWNPPPGVFTTVFVDVSCPNHDYD
jgi:hypothetical protein